ncbi:hypothetical protein [Falsirhodobacter halotolerans]|uniref:hypothetical protein n=1 Tax=Falsirhodobacter halotolerans TaxID=1146892 RepID=UPI001FD505E1|nr:hypothetical protein [Falsirhodobacter halotolerans]MCJ8139579.1 hypothetical protein [Falsirhodobacter halotolerans]
MATAEQISTLKALWFHDTSTRKSIAAALGWSESYMRSVARKAGLPDRRAAPFRQRMTVMIRGQLFENATVAAQHFGLHEDHVHSQIWAGRADGIGLGQGRWKRTAPSPARRPLTIGPMTWESRREAAAGMGVSYVRLCQLMRAKRTDILMARAMKAEAKTIADRISRQHAA